MNELYVWDKVEFIYELGGNYYHLGKCACGECTNQEIIDIYKKYLDVCNLEEFNRCDSYRDARNIGVWNISTIGAAYQKMFEACWVDFIDWTDEMRSLKDRLEERYHDEIEKQVNRMLIARECYGIKQMWEEERRKDQKRDK